MTANPATRTSATGSSLVLGKKLDSIPFAGYHVVLIVVLGFVGFIEGYDLVALHRGFDELIGAGE
jgi:hypothetical protein